MTKYFHYDKWIVDVPPCVHDRANKEWPKDEHPKKQIKDDKKSNTPIPSKNTRKVQGSSKKPRRT